MSDRNASINKTLWLHVAANGRCTSSELMANFPTCGAGVKKALFDMARLGQVVRYPVEGEASGRCAFSYGVTNDCRVPRGVTVAEFVEAVK